ncbi:hypothetical protein [Oleiagrimonas sp. MCCC 1A03011]|uniref:hypothetical protein n=1 Tax=Oleiagrimonas sp. MCCC 1A03011 TaxID=1926883 RepID=UPI000DC20E85|nr:hypothetical protein [Oleiagrimonas sp. MCCC 1A03011]RAP58166.1 hypothetical protein BTJ49_04065 [Oleiagrimonas sp. MCCC 1A03011]
MGLCIGILLVAFAAKGSTPAAHAVGAPCSGARLLARYLGDYRVIAVHKYGGGLTRRKQAMQHLGQQMISLSRAHAAVRGNATIARPIYRVACRAARAEGDVPPAHSRQSDFYGFAGAREQTVTLQVRSPADRDPTPYYNFEFVDVGGARRLVYLSDGWLYVLRRIR